MLLSDLVLTNLKPSPTNSIQIIALHSYACCYCDKTPTHTKQQQAYHAGCNKYNKALFIVLSDRND